MRWRYVTIVVIIGVAVVYATRTGCQVSERRLLAEWDDERAAVATVLARLASEREDECARVGVKIVLGLQSDASAYGHLNYETRSLGRVVLVRLPWTSESDRVITRHYCDLFNVCVIRRARLSVHKSEVLTREDWQRIATETRGDGGATARLLDALLAGESITPPEKTESLLSSMVRVVAVHTDGDGGQER